MKGGRILLNLSMLEIKQERKRRQTYMRIINMPCFIMLWKIMRNQDMA